MAEVASSRGHFNKTITRSLDSVPHTLAYVLYLDIPIVSGYF